MSIVELDLEWSTWEVGALLSLLAFGGARELSWETAISDSMTNQGRVDLSIT